MCIKPCPLLLSIVSRYCCKQNIFPGQIRNSGREIFVLFFFDRNTFSFSGKVFLRNTYYCKQNFSRSDLDRSQSLFYFVPQEKLGQRNMEESEKKKPGKNLCFNPLRKPKVKCLIDMAWKCLFELNAVNQFWRDSPNL